MFINNKDVSCQTFDVITLPVVSGDGSAPILSAPCNFTDMQLYCYINRTDDGVQRCTRWSLIRYGADTVFFIFYSNGTGRPGFDNFVVADGIYHTNLTILSVNSSFDNYTSIGSDVEVQKLLLLLLTSN